MGQAYSQLTLEERRKIERWRHARVSVDEIAKTLNRHRSTIFRELRRNYFSDPELPDVRGYFAVAAQTRSSNRRTQQQKLIRFPDLCRRIVEKIKIGWTPEQIANRMIYEDVQPRVYQETIYRYIYSETGIEQELWWYLPLHRKSRLPRKARKKLPSKFHRDISILFRPEAVAHRRQFGHWEGDLMLFKQHFGQANITSLVERVSRFTVLLRNSSKHTNPVMKKIASAIGTLPFIARRSITFDRGTEFVSWPHLHSEIGTQAWFCDPSAPWQKGTVENTNRRIRRWLPRQINLKAITDHELKIICDRLNQTPRKCLGWKTPAEVFKEKILEQTE
ncbi:IS30 family transposase [Maritalea mobilis]|uniref:IS30 family transposase n=1 Tax=Maritalea mobilis TaxID=483324 RepID=A0A4R6VDN1_9HYPH|nr:IS30 family transposase [Maritalea mobilis]TDQ60451.1 IS30 family transposase [Maritalea mobilis]